MNNKPQSNRQGDRERPEIMRTPRPMMILKAAAWIAYPWLFALVVRLGKSLSMPR
jgi:hypothetical protein